MMRRENVQALERTLDHTRGRYRGTPTPPVLAAVGLPLGVTVSLVGDEEALSGTIRGGRDFYDVSLTEYKVWATALRPQASRELEDWAHSDGILDPRAVITALQLEGFLLLLSGADVLDPELARHYRLHTTGVGLGSTPDDPAKCRIAGCNTDSRVEVDIVLYNVWGASNTSKSLWEVSAEVADAFELEQHIVSTHVLSNLPALMTAGAVFLDTK